MRQYNMTSANESAHKSIRGRKIASSLSQSKLFTASLFDAVTEESEIDKYMREHKAEIDMENFERKVNAACFAIRKAQESKCAVYQVLAVDICGDEYRFEVTAKSEAQARIEAAKDFDTDFIILSIFQMI